MREPARQRQPAGRIAGEMAAALGMVALLLALATPPAALAADVTLTATPAEIVVASGQVTVIVTLTNDGATTLRGARLTPIINGSATYEVTLEPVGTKERSLPPRGTLAWTAMIKPVPGPGPAIVWFRADFEHDPPEVDEAASPRPTAGPAVPGVATASVDLSAGGLSATVAIEGGSGELNDQRFRPIEVHVTNDGTSPFEAVAVPHADDMFEFDAYEATPRTIQPGATVSFPFQVKAADAVFPGERSVVFDVTFAGSGQTRSLIASHTVTLGVLGDTQVAQLVGIPVFFLVPGVLVLLIWQLLGRYVVPLSTRELPTFEERSFWVLAIGLSLLFGLLYRSYTSLLAGVGLIGGERDYLAGYGTRDVFIVWGTAFALTALVYFIGLAYVEFARRNEFKPRDKPLAILEKLGNAGRTVGRQQVERAGARVLLLDEQPKNDKYWASPPIRVEWQRTDGEGDDQLVDLQVAVRGQLHSNGSTARLHAALKAAVESGKAIVRFVPAGPVAAPTLVGVNEITFTDPGLLVEESR